MKAKLAGMAFALVALVAGAARAGSCAGDGADCNASIRCRTVPGCAKKGKDIVQGRGERSE